MILILTLKKEKRKNADNKFQKDFFKLLINSVYGKTIESLGTRVSVKLVDNEKDLLKHTNKPTYISRKIFDKNYAAIYRIKSV